MLSNITQSQLILYMEDMWTVFALTAQKKLLMGSSDSILALTDLYIYIYLIMYFSICFYSTIKSG